MQASPEVARQMGLVLKDYAAMTPTQLKMDTNLVYAARVAKGFAPVVGVPDLTPSVDVLPDNTINCDIKVNTDDTASLVKAIESAGGTITEVSKWAKNVRAFLPLLQIEALAGRSDIISIDRAIVPVLLNPRKSSFAKKPLAGAPYRSSTGFFNAKPKTAAARLAASLAALPTDALSQPLMPLLIQAQTQKQVQAQAQAFGPNFDTEGYYGHQIDVASASPYNMTGAGIKIGVLSDGVANLAKVQQDGYLGPVTVVLDSPGNSGEGTAMLQIVHNMAPDAQLFFATGFRGFGDAIIALRETYGCDIILDDLGEGQPAFSEGDVAQAVNRVTAEGAIYFSSAGNQGNNNHYDSGTTTTHHDAQIWEGDFAPSGSFIDPAVGTGNLHLFTGPRDNVNNAMPMGGLKFPYDVALTDEATNVNLEWSDAYGQGYTASGNKYVVYATDNMGMMVTSVGLPNRSTPIASCKATRNQRIYAGLLSGVPCALRLARTKNGGSDSDTLQLTTAGESTAHNAGRNTLGVGAIGAAGTTSAFTSANSNISFSSDGPRRLFWTAEGNTNHPIVPNVHTFAENGYITLLKPDVTAANGVTTDAPGFKPFYGTSAASPHAGAIAGLVLSYGTPLSPRTVTVTTGTGATAATYGTTTIVGRNLVPTDMKTVLTSSAIDNNVGLNASTTSSYDTTGGFGIVMPVLAAQYLQKFFDPATVGTSAVNPTTYKVTWNTNLPATSIVHYGTSKTTLNQTARVSGTASTAHTVSIPNVSATTPVYYTIETATPSGSVAFLGSAPAQLNPGTVTVPAPKSNVVLSNLALSRLSSGQIQAVVTLTNSGAGVSGAISVSATLAGVTGAPAPAAITAIAAGKTGKATFMFPTVPSGTQTQFVLSGTEGSNVISSTTQVKVP